MDELLTDRFVSEIYSQCHYSNLAIKRFNPFLTGERQFENVHDYTCFFEGMYSFLNYCSNISRIFWPTYEFRKKDKEAINAARRARSEHLRSMFSLENDSPLQQRELRNKLTHVDETLEDWYRTTTCYGQAKHLIGPRDMIGGLEDGDRFEHYIPSEEVFIYRGYEQHLRPVNLERIKVFAIAEKYLSSRNLISRLDI